MEIWGYVCAVCYGALCLLASYVLSRIGVRRVYTRKLVHIAIGFEWVILYSFLGATWHSFIICLAFTGLLVLSHYKGFLPMISSGGENSYGTILYGASMCIISFVSIFLPELMLPFGVAVVCTSLGDGLAGVLGYAFKKQNASVYKNKTIIGVLVNFSASFVGVLLFNLLFELKLTLLHIFVIAVFSSILEVITLRGFDNLSVPIGVCALTYLLVYVPAVNNYLVPIILTPLIAVIVKECGVLTLPATLCALALDVAVSIAFGNFGFTVLLTFLILSLIADSIKNKKYKMESETRDSIQVLSNGGAAFVCAIAYVFVPKTAFMVAFVGVVSQALSDTVASGFGAYANRTFDLFRMKKCEAGVSGGVSIPGTVAALVVAFIIPLIAFAFGMIELIYVLICGTVGFVATFVDTMIGSLFEEKYVCKRCRRITDQKLHCKLPTTKYSGYASVDNNVTNLISNVFAAVILILVGM